MDIHSRLQQIEQLYILYDRFMRPYPWACQAGCDTCCTSNVWITTIEGIWILENLTQEDKQILIGHIDHRSDPDRFRPQLTTNDIAGRCARGESLPDEAIAVAGKPCPVLTDRHCSIYALRPFGCRCMVSNSRCSTTGQAEMDELIISAGTLMMQIIEHIDAGGYSGNFADILACLHHGNIQKPSEIPSAQVLTYNLIANHPAAALMIPPAQRAKLQPLLIQIQRVLNPVPTDR